MGFVNIQNTNFENGIINRNAANLFGSMGQLDPTKFHTYMEDFDTYLAGEWVVTEVGVATQVLTDADGGRLLITNAAADNDSSFQQKVGESFILVASLPLYFRALFQVSDATQSDFVCGLQDLDTTPLAASDGVWFQKDDGDALLDIHHAIGSVQTDALAIATVVAATDISVEFYWDGISRIYYGVNGTPLGFLEPANIVTTELTLSFGIQNGEAVAKTMTMDYLFCAKERS